MIEFLLCHITDRYSIIYDEGNAVFHLKSDD